MKTHTILLCIVGIVTQFLLADFEEDSEKYFEQDNNNSFAAQDILHDIIENTSY